MSTPLNTPLGLHIGYNIFLSHMAQSNPIIYTTLLQHIIMDKALVNDSSMENHMQALCSVFKSNLYLHEPVQSSQPVMNSKRYIINDLVVILKVGHVQLYTSITRKSLSQLSLELRIELHRPNYVAVDLDPGVLHKVYFHSAEYSPCRS